jgi:hypothetical protein
VANQAKRPNKRRVEGGGRVTPKGGPTPRKKPVPKSAASGAEGPDPSSRYTPPVPSSYMESPRWVPVVMFGLFAIGMVVIVLHYMGVLLPSAESNWWLAAGLGAILGGIITATQLR